MIISGGWVGIIANVDKEEEEDVQVKFMHPSGPSRSFQLMMSVGLLMILFYAKLTFP